METSKVIDTIIKNMVYIEWSPLNYISSTQPAACIGFNQYPFWLCKYVLTKIEWLTINGGDIHVNEDDSNKPVTNVSWLDCQDFILKLNRLSGLSFRLPTRLEWEFAALGGIFSHGYMYAGSNDYNEVAWFREVRNVGIHDVGLKKPNELGLYDMSGNVWEWCNDSYMNYTQISKEGKKDPLELLIKKERIVKGGSCAIKSTIVNTYGHSEDYCGDYIGLRLAL